MRTVWRAAAMHPNGTVFAIGLVVLCASLAQWSGPLAGTVFGGVLMLIAAWPFLGVRKR